MNEVRAALLAVRRAMLEDAKAHRGNAELEANKNRRRISEQERWYFGATAGVMDCVRIVDAHIVAMDGA